MQRRRVSREFKIEAVKLVRERGSSGLSLLHRRGVSYRGEPGKPQRP
ncbi:hypothetical protein SAMN05443247_09271 [Bradyrhizobium erythrophlei]|nr:hypothetical protein SAMN05443247_09271 [Bradyrhizobium erythrophlei]